MDIIDIINKVKELRQKEVTFQDGDIVQTEDGTRVIIRDYSNLVDGKVIIKKKTEYNRAIDDVITMLEKETKNGTNKF